MKKCLSILLGMVLILSIFTMIPFSVSAGEAHIAETGIESTGNSTYDAFISDSRWMSGIGWGYYQTPKLSPYDSIGCCAYASDFAKFCFNSDAPVYGSYFSSISDIRAGDVVYVAGHWLVVLKRSGNSLYTAEGNFGNAVRIGWCYSISDNYLAGDFTAQFQYGYHFGTPIVPAPANAWIKASNTSIPTGTSITFTFGADYATGYTIGINRNGSRIITEGVSSGKSYTFNDAGDYTAYVTATNSSGGRDSNVVSFSVFTPINLGDGFVATITNSKGGMNIGANSDGNVELQTKSDSDDQKWHFERQSNNTYKIINVGQGKCLDVANFGTANGTNIGLCPSNDSNAQRYYIRETGSGYGIVPMVNTGAAIDISGGNLVSGTNIQEYTWNGSFAQVFSIDYVGLEPTVAAEYNGHTYEFYNINTSWNQAYRFCESKGGHLVTIADQAENEFVDSIIDTSVWMGGTAFGNNKKWYWVTGEPFEYVNWHTNQPDYYGNAEFYLEMYHDGTNDKKWNDLPLDDYGIGIPFVCEYDNGDVNADSYTPVASEKIDGTTYSVFDYCVDWQTAEAICEAKGGQLVKIDSAEKNEIVAQMAAKGSKPEYWINATDRFSEGSWTDAEGNPLTYFNWADTDPTNDINAEQYICIRTDTGKWLDLKGFSPAYRNTGFICEIHLPTKLTLSPGTLKFKIGEVVALKATVAPEGADDSLIWTSDNETVATVDENGNVTAHGVGTATICAETVNGLKAYCNVTVALSNTVTFNANGHGTAPAKQTVFRGEKVKKPANPSETGWSFGGWFTDKACTNAYDFSTAVTKNLTLYAKWTQRSFTVTFDANGHGTAPAAQTVKYGETAVKPADPTDANWSFVGWYVDQPCTTAYNFSKPIVGPRTLYAKWTQEKFTVTFNVNGHGTAPAKQTVRYGLKATKPANPSETGWIFGGWFTDKACTKSFSFSTAITKATTLYAKWTIRSFTVTFDANGHGKAPAAQTVKYNETAVKPADPTDADWSFVGWYIDADCTSAYNFSKPIVGPRTLYAKWTQEKYTVTFNANGHGTAPAKQTVRYGLKATKPANPSETGWSFGGWFTDKACTKSFSFSTAITKATTLYAKWTIRSFTVTFDANGHGKAPAAQTVKYNETAVKPADPTDADWTFVGWYTDQACTTAFNFSKPIVGPRTLYAKWKQTVYFNVTFNANGHGTAPAVQSVKEGGKATKPTNPSETGWSFGGWFTDKACTKSFSFSTAINKATTLYAKWTIRSFTVTFDVNGHGTAPAVQTVKYGDTAVKPADPSDADWSFVGWYIDADCTSAYNFSRAIVGPRTLYAKWTQEKYTVTFNANGHSIAPAKQTVRYGLKATKPGNPSETGWSFGGWFTDKVCTKAYDFSTPVTKNLTLYAKWTQRSFTVTFDANGHGTAPAAQTVKYGETAVKPADPTADGWSFGGWYIDADCTGAYNFSRAIVGPRTLYAKWIKNS